MSNSTLARLLENYLDPLPDDGVQRGRARFIEAAGGAELGRGRGWRSLWLLPLALTCAVAGAAVALQLRAHPSPEHRPLATASATRLEGPVSGVSTVELGQGARAELSPSTLAYRRLDSGARHQVELVRGKVRFDIDPSPRASWTILAGTVQVSVIGTIFSVEHDASTERVCVEVERGLVRVLAGGRSAQHLQLSAGQSLVVQGGKLEIAEAQHSRAPAPDVLGKPEAPSVAAPAVSNRATSPRELFGARYRERDYPGALAFAEQAGFETATTTWDRVMLWQLADAARLAGAPLQARRALESLRRRFAGSRESADAAFLLGRLHADALGSPGAAAQWFERYGVESPRGAYAHEALGRLMVATRAAGDMARARGVASRYLERYPEGPYAKTAASLLP